MFGVDRRTIIQFVKFNLVGGINTVLATLVYVAVAALTDNYTLGLISDYAFGIVFGFIANKIWTFGHQEPFSLRLVAKYIAVYAVVFAINYSLLRLAVEHYGYDRYLAQFVIFAVVVLPIFIVQKKYVFADKRATTEGAA